MSNVAENILTAAEYINELLYGNIDVFRNIFELAKRHTKELLRININAANAIENTERKTVELSFTRQKEVYT